MFLYGLDLMHKFKEFDKIKLNGFYLNRLFQIFQHKRKSQLQNYDACSMFPNFIFRRLVVEHNERIILGIHYPYYRTYDTLTLLENEIIKVKLNILDFSKILQQFELFCGIVWIFRSIIFLGFL